MDSAKRAQRTATLRAVILVLIGAVGVQFSSVIAIGLFESIGVMQVSALRLLIAAAVLLIVFRPRLRGKTRDEWFGIIIYGIAMAAMNFFLYLAIDRVPLGVATTIDFLGPCLVALATSKRLRESLLAVVAFAGVALIAGFAGPFDPLGLIYSAAAGVCFGLYTVLAARVGKSASGLPSVALAVAFAAIVALPLSLPAIPTVQPGEWGILTLSALLGMALAFTVDTLAGKFTSARVIGVLFAFDPVVGTILGALLLDQVLTFTALGGMTLVIAAGAGIVWFAGAPSSSGPSAGAAAQDTPTENSV